MAKSLGAALVGAFVGVLMGAWFLQLQTQGTRAWRERELWPQVAHAELTLAKGLDAEGLPTLVALAEELHALRVQAALRNTFDLRHWFHALSTAKPDEGSEERAADFMIQKVTATLNTELDRWQNKMDQLNRLDPIARGAVMRLLAYVKWQQKGGEYEYAYEFFEELSRTAEAPAAPPKENAPAVEPTPARVATPAHAMAPTPAPRPVRHHHRRTSTNEHAAEHPMPPPADPLLR